MEYTLNIRGRLLSLSEARVMGILNVTPDSFYAGSRTTSEKGIIERAHAIVDEGGTIIDVGACSTRPGSTPVSQDDEMTRLRQALSIVRREQPQAVVSVDTFRPDVARMAVEEYGADIINDVAASDDMLRMIARMHVPYILTSSEPTLAATMLFFADRVQRLRDMGCADIILDPGFGFGKTLDENYALLRQLSRLHVLELPLLVGLSRKSMICRLLGIDPSEALSATTALHAVALLQGASILRVHDVTEAVQCVRLVGKVNKP